MKTPHFTKLARCLSTLAGLLLISQTSAQTEQRYSPYNIEWDSQSVDSSESMPCGGGDTGLNVWVENGEILFYIQRSGSLAEQNQYLKLGRVRLNLTPNPFAASGVTFSQKLNLAEGHIEITGQAPTGAGGGDLDATVRIWVETERPVVRVDVEASEAIDVRASYENWRLQDEVISGDVNRQNSFFTMVNYPSPLTLGKDEVAHTAGGVQFYHRNPASTVVDILINQQDMVSRTAEITNDLANRTFGGLMTGAGFAAAGDSLGTYQGTNYKAWHLDSTAPSTTHNLRIVSHIDQTTTLAEWENDLNLTVSQSSSDRAQAFATSVAWWDQFWNRSWIQINPTSPDQSDQGWRVGRNYNLFRYQLGCNKSGEYPTKFNGGNFTYDSNLIPSGRSGAYGPDWRDWGGGVHTAQNQRLVYWPMLKTGDADLIIPQFELYRKALPGATARVDENFGHPGAVYSEYANVPGLALGAGYGWTSGGRTRGTEIPFGDSRADANKGYGDVVEKGVMANPVVSYHWCSQIEHSYMILEHHRFTGNSIAQYMPFIENSLIFFDEHYRARQQIRNGQDYDVDGNLVIFPSTVTEDYRGATNPADVVSGLKACLESIIELDDSLLQLRDKAYYTNFLATIPPLTFGTDNGDRIIEPAKSFLTRRGIEGGQFYPLFPFNQFNLLTTDSNERDTFIDTLNSGTVTLNNVNSWRQEGIFMARMGLVSEAKTFNTNKLDDSPRRFPTFWGPGFDWVPDHNWGGSGMIGLQEMLMHTIGDEINLLPAWPTDWDVDFKLHAPGQTIVERVVRGGKLRSLQVTPSSRLNDVVIASAFTGNIEVGGIAPSDLNTEAVSGASPWKGITGAPVWQNRVDEFGVYTADEDLALPANDYLKLKTTITGLLPGKTYAISLEYAAKDNWGILGGLAENTLEGFAATNQTIGSTAHLGENDGSGRVTDAGRVVNGAKILRADLGSIVADANGEIEVFIDDAENNGESSAGLNQAWYSGVFYFLDTSLDPPVPNPAGFAENPNSERVDQISMRALPGSSPNGIVEYYFAETSGNPGGSDSGWQTSPTYTDNGLSAVTQYTYTVQMRDPLGNLGAISAPESATTALENRVKADDSNTVAVNGDSPWQVIARTPPIWRNRQADFDVYTADEDGTPTRDYLQLRTTVDGLKPFRDYTVSIEFGSIGNWAILGAVDKAQPTFEGFAGTNLNILTVPYLGADDASGRVVDTGTDLSPGISLYRGELLESATSTATGEISVLIDDPDNTGISPLDRHRCWYVGIAYREADSTTDYATWAAANSITGPADQDSNGNGIPDGVEFFTGVTGQAIGDLIQLDLDTPNELNVSIPFDPQANAEWQIQVSDELENWTSYSQGSPEVQFLETPFRIQLSVPNSYTKQARFVRLAVTTSP